MRRHRHHTVKGGIDLALVLATFAGRADLLPPPAGCPVVGLHPDDDEDDTGDDEDAEGEEARQLTLW